MPKRTDLENILILGSGPIVIGQACEFDYSGTQAVRALREEGYRVVLVNSNPATIMTDPELADRTYIEPLTAEWVERVIERERPDALLPTMGGQTAINIAMELEQAGVLERYGVELIGANARSISMCEDREEFTLAMRRIGLEVPAGGVAGSMEQARALVAGTGYPAIIRPGFTLGGTGGGIAYNAEEFDDLVRRGLDASPITQVLIDRSVIGWKEYELEVVRDASDNVIVVCSIENFDPMGIHTGDSITVAPAQTLADVEYQTMRDAAIAVIREIGVEAGGCNIQFAVNPDDGELLVVEMNPRVSRSSALASKATGFPIARVGAKLAVGFVLSELPNDITRTTPASFEPVLDYVVTKFPRFAFEKFPETDGVLGVQMQAVGETMAIGRTFRASWQKGLRGLEVGRAGWTAGKSLADDGLESDDRASLLAALRIPTAERPFQLRRALAAVLRGGEGAGTEPPLTLGDVHRATGIDPWFLDQLMQVIEDEQEYAGAARVTPAHLRAMKRDGFSDRQLAALRGETEAEVRARRHALDIRPTYNVVDTCAGEFPAATPYYYSSYEDEDESDPTDRDKVLILGSGPNRIGQGIEFDYCCVQAVLALREAGYETIMVNSNPETVSTDFDVSDKLYFEPLTLEDVLEIVEREKPIGVVVQLGGQTPLSLAQGLAEAGAPILGTPVDAIDRAEDRGRFERLCRRIGAAVPPNGVAASVQEAVEVGRRVGYPVLVRPSYVLGGRAMHIVYDEASLRSYFVRAMEAAPEHPVLIDRFLEDAFEADVDALSDGVDVVIGGIMQHIEEAGIHSGDSACVLPPYLLTGAELEEMRELTRRFALELGVIGVMNVQYAIRDGRVYVLEVNPRASRTVPFVGKATGVPLARLAARVMAGERLADLNVPGEPSVPGVAVKEAVFPFNRFDVDVLLGPEMRSTGEVMGFDDSFGMAFAKAQTSAGNHLPEGGGTVIITVNDSDKPTVTPLARRFHDLGFRILATAGTCAYLNRLGVPAERIFKVNEGRPDIVDMIVSGRAQLLVNTPLGKKSQYDDFRMRRAAITNGVPYLTTMSAMTAACDAVIALRSRAPEVRSLQDRLAPSGNGNRTAPPPAAPADLVAAGQDAAG
ncbi:MAG: carbamoyl-phosphate synthase large subunit [Gammaproteobacteria bacterium]|nr:carbamoyl-phosphate synthase large subunit [Gammaproteobacteria bacterium]MXW09417.1 carbamoyl-phosphate synthase large subunit [Gammaproteobacteria bacterium]MYC51583.1 carbamoyl-phosphate synthase large subunit [Gammaproteobacteria bacterium]